MKATSIILLFAFTINGINGQIGGLNTFEFLNLTQSARSTAMGGYMTAIDDDDINLIFSNPALLQSEMNNQIAINHNFHFAGITHGFVAYGHHVDKWDATLSAGVNYISYGDFVRSDNRSNDLGAFNARESAVQVGISKIIKERLSIGANLKFINSTFDSYSSVGVGLDIGLNYKKAEKLSSYSLVLKNIGLQLNDFDLERESLPFDIQLGYSKKLEHLPFRLSITARNLNQWGLRSENPTDSDPIFINQLPTSPSGLSIFVDNLFRHLVFGGELIVGKKEILRLRFGYNRQKNKDLSTSAFRSFSGFSYGFGVKIKKFRFDYAIATYHLAGSVNHLSLIIDMDEWFNKI